MKTTRTLLLLPLFYPLHFHPACGESGSGRWTTIRNGVEWTDTEGYIVQAHGGNFLKVGKTWYLVGEDRARTWNPDVNLYSTTDFVNWKFERKIVANQLSHDDLGRTRMIERPKLLHNPTTGQFVLWCHWEARDYSASEAAVFVCDSVNGDYEYVWSGRPLGTKSRDCNIFVDDDGTAYFISTTDENTNLGLFQLSDDYLKPVSKVELCRGQRREAPVIVHIADTYYMVSSACTGWDPNQAKLATLTATKEGDNLSRLSQTIGWSPLTDIGDRIAYDTQASSILTIRGTEGTSYLYVGDRWMDPDLPRSKIIILPIEFDQDGHMVLNYREQFEIDFERGIWR